MSSTEASDPILKAVFPAIDGFALTFQERRAVPRNGIAAKRRLDVIVAGLAIALLAPLLALTALLVKLDSKGPVIFSQRRTGLGGRTFAILKFRSMRVLEDGAEVKQAVEGDDRITRVGRIIRKLSIDELPQLFNVLKGDMSLVGPRPHAIAHDEYYGARISNYGLRFKVKPGITGWAQVNGLRGETDTLDKMAARIEYDLEYLRNWTLGLDLLIIARTVKLVFFDRGAY